jgi:PIN domain nuclease of toxin-antitoxin system
MSAVVADTHNFLWFLNRDARLSTVARSAMRKAQIDGNPIYVSAVSIVAMRYLVEKNRIGANDYKIALQILRSPLTAPSIVPLVLEIADALDQISRAVVPDMPDRIIAATAKYLNLPLVTADKNIRASGINVIW